MCGWLIQIVHVCVYIIELFLVKVKIKWVSMQIFLKKKEKENFQSAH